MNTADLLEHVKSNIPAYLDPTLVESGTGYHYTSHSGAIQISEGFYGQPVDSFLSATQRHPGPSLPATDESGVVFLFEELATAVQEGKGQQIILVRYRSGVAATQQFDDASRRKYGVTQSREILVLAAEIDGFQLLGPADEIPLIKPDIGSSSDKAPGRLS